MKRTLLAIIAIIVTIAACRSQTDYRRLEGKATRFFDNSEWASANAMYILMLDINPASTDTYAHAVVSNIMAGDTVSAVQLVPKAMSYEVPIDSLLIGVRDVSFSIGRGDLYKNYLQHVKQEYSWLGRIADNYLMRYYAFRQNGPELIRYAHIMLAGMPDNREFLRMLAHGQMLSGDSAGAARTWHRVIQLNPDDYTTTLDLANYYDCTNDTTMTLQWMRRANALRPTPYVSARIKALSTRHKSK